jgi:hypothetical protein
VFENSIVIRQLSHFLATRGVLYEEIEPTGFDLGYCLIVDFEELCNWLTFQLGKPVARVMAV